jgi:hypothetical protein
MEPIQHLDQLYRKPMSQHESRQYQIYRQISNRITQIFISITRCSY